MVCARGPAPDIASTCEIDITDIRLLLTRPSISLGVSSCSRTNQLRAGDNADTHQRADRAEKSRSAAQHVAHIDRDQGEKAPDDEHPGHQGMMTNETALCVKMNFIPAFISAITIERFKGFRDGSRSIVSV